MTTSLHVLNASIASGQTAGVSFRIPNGALVGLAFGTMTGSTCKIQGSFDSGVTWLDIYRIDGTTLLSVPTLGIQTIPPIDSAAAPELLRLVSGTAEAAARTVRVLHRALS